MDKKISKNRHKKQAIVTELVEKLKSAKGLIFANYQGLTHKQLETLKKGVKAVKAELVVTKNTLLKLALEKVSKGESPFDTSGTFGTFHTFRNPTATLFLYGDPIEPLKQLAKVIKALNLPAIKFGILDGREMTKEQLMKLSTLPPYEVLLTQLVVGLKSPISGLHRALNWNLQKFVMTLKAIESKEA